MGRSDVTIFDVDEGANAQVTLTGAQAAGLASAVSAESPSNDVEITLTGLSARGIPGVVDLSTGDVFNPDFPRLAAYRIGRKNWGDNPTRTGLDWDVDVNEVANLAAFHWSIINAQQGRGASFVTAASDWVTRCRAINSDHIRFLYTDMQETGSDDSTVTNQKLLSETGPTGNGGTWLPNDWLGRDTSGGEVSAFAGLRLVNPTVNVTRDSSNLIFPEWYADYVYPRDFEPHNSGDIDFHLYDDVVDHVLRTNRIDLNRNGLRDEGNRDWDVPGSEGAEQAELYRQGHRIYSDRMISKKAGLLSIVNAVRWFDEYTSPNPDDAPPIHSFYEGAFHGGVVEGQSVDNTRNPFSGLWTDGFVNSAFGSFRMAMNGYMYQMRHMLSPKLVCNAWGADIPTRSLNPVVGTDITARAMKGCRFAIGCTLLDDGYVYITNELDRYNSSPHWDEYGTVNQSVTGLSGGYLGQRVGLSQSAQEDITKQSSVWLGSDLNGIFKAVFLDPVSGKQRVVLVNSRKSDTGSITIPVHAGADEDNGELEAGKWTRFQGHQDPIHNNGQTVNSNLDVDSFDSYILLEN